MTYRLYDFAASPFCIKVRFILAYKHIPFERVDTVGPAMLEVRKRGRIGKVPALDMDGDFICDSTDIAYALDNRHPTPPILPDNARKHAECHVLEDWADESLYWFGVYYRWQDREGRSAAPGLFPRNFLGQQLMPRIVASAARKQLIGQGLGRKTATHIQRDLLRNLDQLEHLLDGRDFLLDNGPMLCDFAVGAQLIYLWRTPIGQRLLAPRKPVVQYIERMLAFPRSL